jgi:hypothetical protein
MKAISIKKTGGEIAKAENRNQMRNNELAT